MKLSKAPSFPVGSSVFTLDSDSAISVTSDLDVEPEGAPPSVM